MNKGKIKFISGKKKWFWIIGLLLVIAAATAAGLFFYSRQKSEQTAEMMQMPTGFSFSENVITTSGLTQVGMAAQEWELDFLTEGLEVEETYLHVGDAVDAHTPIFKVTDESLEIAREELQLAEKEASLNLREGQITYETGKIDAQKEYDLAQVEANYAQTTYDSALLTAQQSLDNVQAQVDEAQEKVDEYTASIESNYYYTYYEVKEKQDLWYEYGTLLIELYDKWNVDYLEDMYGGMGNSMGGTGSFSSGSDTTSGASSAGQSGESSGAGSSSGGTGDMPSGDFPSGEMPSGTPMSTAGKGESESALYQTVNTLVTKSMRAKMQESAQANTDWLLSNMTVASGSTWQLVNVNSDDQSKYQVYSMLEEECALRKQEYEEALENYENAKATAAAGIEQAKSELAVLQAKLVKQQDTYDKAKLAAQATYDKAMAARDSAQMVYESTMEQLEEDYEALQDKQEEAAENLALLEEKVGDGYFYTEEAGTVMMNNVKEADVLTQATMILAYQDTYDITVTASVDQSNIASISIGQEVVIYVSGYEAMEGAVTAIDPVSGSSRASSVTYSVTVAPAEPAQGLEGNMTAYVYFGLTEEEKEMMTTGFGGNR